MAVNLDPLLILCVRAFTSVLLILVPLLPQTSRFTGKTKGILLMQDGMVHHLEKTTHLKSAKVPIIGQPHQLRRWSELAISLDAPCTPRPHIPLDTRARASTGASGMTYPAELQALYSDTRS
ncbi:hypothetical protein B0H14DRAFT_3432840 [Mycena olivaceomarginata]|nr:hypothetical protein B0H14DRAFT_3432840 [Mycena olivaceomarginata]